MSRASADDVRAALARLRRAGAALRARPATATLDALARVLDAWRDPASKARLSLASALPEATGFSLPVVRAGLAHALETWTGDALRALVDDELGGAGALDGRGPRPATGFDVTSVLLAGALPTPALLALIAPLVLRSAVLARPSSHDPVTARVVAASLAEVDALLGDCIEVVPFPAADAGALDAFLAADCVVATGSDETVASVAARVRPPRRLVTYGHRVSVAAVGPHALSGERLAAACEGLALDVALWDQSGCLSPVSVHAVSADAAAADRLAEGLAVALSRAAAWLPRGRIPVAAGAAFARTRDEAELRAASGRPVAVHGGPADPWCIVREDDPAPRPAPLHRFVRVHPCPDLGVLDDALRPLGPHLAAVALSGFGGETERAVRLATALGASRICAPGRMQAPPLGWRHDGRGVLAPLARGTDVEGPIPAT